MPDLQHALQGNDLGFLRMVAGTWGIELNAPDAHAALPLLVGGILNAALVSEVVETLPPQVQGVLQALLEHEGRIPWAAFTRRFGEVRTMGAARRDRERPDLKPISPAEVLWYRALISKAFFNTPPEPQEYAYIPDDLLEFLQPLSAAAPQPLGRPASPLECAVPLPAHDRILDRACTLLAAARLSMPLEPLPGELPPQTLKALLFSAGLLDEHDMPRPEAVRDFLAAPRGEALAQLVRGWMQSITFNELHLLPGLKCEGEWKNDPYQARQAVLDLLSHLPQDRWWNLNSFIAAVRERNPDFQRPAGDYDSWFIRKESSAEFLRGFAAWDEVDGALLRYLIELMHHLGLFDLAAPEGSSIAAAFRPSAWAAALWHGSAPEGLPLENGQVHLTSSGALRLPPLTPRAVRYQIARFCQWEKETTAGYDYRLTPAALERARQQGLRASQLVKLLQRHAAGPLPPNLLQALEHWEQSGVQARVEPLVVLRVSSVEIVTALRKTRAARYLGEALSPTVIIIKTGGETALINALTELGYLAESNLGNRV